MVAQDTIEIATPVVWRGSTLLKTRPVQAMDLLVHRDAQNEKKSGRKIKEKIQAVESTRTKREEDGAVGRNSKLKTGNKWRVLTLMLSRAHTHTHTHTFSQQPKSYRTDDPDNDNNKQKCAKEKHKVVTRYVGKNEKKTRGDLKKSMSIETIHKGLRS
jgi:hypothetical protein